MEDLAGEEVKTVIDDFKKKAEEEQARKKGVQIRNKIRAMGRIGKIYNVLKEEHETILRLKNMAPDGKLPHGLLL